MSSNTDGVIVCRRCGETVRMDTGSCPHCGASVRSRVGPIAALIVGLVIMGSSALDIGTLWAFGLVGFVVAFGGAYFLYDRRRRIKRASSPSGGT